MKKFDRRILKILALQNRKHDLGLNSIKSFLIPDIYVKGKEFEKLEDKTGKIQKEYAVIKEIGAELRFTHEIVFSSTKLLNSYFTKKEDNGG